MATLSPFVLRLDIIGSNLDRMFCPHCNSHDRERHLRLYIERLGLLPAVHGSAVLHIGPEGHLIQIIRAHEPARYVLGDLHPANAEIERIDLQAIPFSDSVFDLVICNHIFEHVADFRRSLTEAVRVLKPGGRLICQTPFAARLSTTFEDASLQSEDDRMFFYAQENHLRLFGRDIVTHLKSAGLRGRLREHDEILPEIDPENYGVNEREPFFDFVRA